MQISRVGSLKTKAERVGFEPTVPYGTRALQARAISRTTRPLHSSSGKNYNMVVVLRTCILDKIKVSVYNKWKQEKSQNGCNSKIPKNGDRRL